jgi:hypothetical protein
MALTKAHNRMIAGSEANLKDFGAAGDGITDDTAAVQAALNSGSTRIHAPAGNYLVSGLTCDTRGMILYGDGIEATVFTYSGSTGDVFTLTSGQMRFMDFDVDGSSTTGSCFQSSEAGSAQTAGVYEFVNIRASDAGYGWSLGEAPGDFNQADSRWARCTAVRMSQDAVKVVHDQGVNYVFEQFVAAEIMGSAWNFERGGRMVATQTAIREVGTILQVQGAGENSDYFDLNGVSVDGSTGTAYPQWHKLVDADSGRITITNYSSGNSPASPTDPLIILNGYGEIRFEDSVVLPEYTWDGATGVPIVELTGLSTTTIASFFAKNVQLGSYSFPSRIDWTTFIRTTNSFVYASWTGVFSKGQRYTEAPKAVVNGTVTVAGASDVSVAWGGVSGNVYIPVVGRNRPVLLALRILSGSISAGQSVQVKLQRRRGGVLSTIATYTVDSTIATPEYLIGIGDLLSPAIDFVSGDEFRIAVNDNGGTGATPTLSVTFGLADA